MKFIIPCLFLVSCIHIPQASQAPNTSNKPHWVNSTNLKEGLVCSQYRGIYPLEKAYELAINSCLINLSNKSVTGNLQVKKTLDINKNSSGEDYHSTIRTNNDFIVKANNSDVLSYDVLGKYYDAKIEKAFVWIKLK